MVILEDGASKNSTPASYSYNGPTIDYVAGMPLKDSDTLVTISGNNFGSQTLLLRSSLLRALSVCLVSFLLRSAFFFFFFRTLAVFGGVHVLGSLNTSHLNSLQNQAVEGQNWWQHCCGRLR